jgi:polyphosphate kinase
MVRNLSDRVEVVTPVTSAAARERLWEILDVALKDRRQAWEMNSDGSYTQLRPVPSGDGPESLGTHRLLMDLTRDRSG